MLLRSEVAVLVVLGLVAFPVSLALPCVSSVPEAMTYLEKYGYMEKHEKSAYVSAKEKNSAIKEFQKMTGAKPTGIINKETMTLMKMPRCGMPDKYVGEAPKVAKWTKKSLTYRVSNYPAGSLTKRQVDGVIKKAFKMWSDETDLAFAARAAGDVDIEMAFAEPDHGDGSTFDGPGCVLAHAFFPSLGSVHFDNDELWTVRSEEGTNLLQVAAHEIGHSLGLNHSDAENALMAPIYRGYSPSFILDWDDIRRIRVLYGKKRQASPSTTPTTSTRGTTSKPPTVIPGRFRDDSFCKYPSFDTIFTDLEGVTYVMKGQRYWTLDSAGVINGFPRFVQTKWPGLPACVDAAFAYPRTGRTYFFSGASVWSYDGNGLAKGYPKLITRSFPGIPDYVDSAFVWPKNDQIYFFKGGDFWKFDASATPAVGVDYPRRIDVWWRGATDALDAVFSLSDGRSYFVKDARYAKIDDRDDNVRPEVQARGDISELFGCKPAVS